MFQDLSQDLFFPFSCLRTDLRHFLFWACMEVCRYVGAYLHTLLTLPAWYYISSPWSLHPYISTCRPNLSLLEVWNWCETHLGLIWVFDGNQKYHTYIRELFPLQVYVYRHRDPKTYIRRHIDINTHGYIYINGRRNKNDILLEVQPWTQPVWNRFDLRFEKA